MSVDTQWDVVVVGAGLAGLMAACTCAKAGLRVTILERSIEERYLCNSRLTGGIFHLAFHGLLDDESKILNAAIQATAGTADAQLLEAIVRDAKRAVQVLASIGVRFMRNGSAPWQRHVLAPPVLPKLDRRWQGRGGDVMLRTLESYLAGHGTRIERGVAAQALELQDGAVAGVRVRSAGAEDRVDDTTLRTRAVVLADGGFQANPQELQRHITPAPERMVQRNARSGLGDGIRMAEAIGAAITDRSQFYGHVLSRDALTNDQLWPYPWVDELARSCLILAPNGERFVDEGLGGVYIANALARLPDPASAVVVFDHAAWNGPAKERALSSNPFLIHAGATVWVAPDLTTLARKCGLPLAPMQQSIERYNAALAAGTANQLTPARSTHRYAPWPIMSPPFYAIPLAAGITYTMGGIRIDAHARVLTKNATPIAGLYAAGSTTGGLEGGPEAGYVGGLCKAAVTGLRAGEHICLSRPNERPLRRK